MSRPSCNTDVIKKFDILISKGKISFVSPSMSSSADFDITLKDLFRRIERLDTTPLYSFDNMHEYKDYDIENGSIPFINFAFYFALYKLGHIPSFKELCNAYFSLYCTESSKGKAMVKFRSDFDDDGLYSRKFITGRIYRAFYSYYRELEILLFLSEKEDIEVQYRFLDDIDGVDLTVRKDGKEVLLASYYASSRSQHFKDKKDTERHDTEKMHSLINIKAALPRPDRDTGMWTKNGVYLHSKKSLENLYEKILKKFSENA